MVRKKREIRKEIREHIRECDKEIRWKFENIFGNSIENFENNSGIHSGIPEHSLEFYSGTIRECSGTCSGTIQNVRGIRDVPGMDGMGCPFVITIQSSINIMRKHVL